MKFSLVDEPWIECFDRTGSARRVSIRDALVHAHELRSVESISPLVTAAVHRLLLAVLYRCQSPASLAEWARLYQVGAFDGAAIDAYVTKWRERFDLLHPEVPFGQVRGMPFDDYVDPASDLVTERNPGSEGVQALFQSRPGGFDDSLSLAESAGWLLAFQAFCPGGLVKKPGEPTSASAAPTQSAAVTLLRGHSLFETLCLNLVNESIRDARGLASPIDAPSWEREPPPARLGPTQIERMPLGLLDMLTWQSRRMELRVVEGRVVGVVRAVFQKMDAGAPPDPLVAYVMSEKRGRLPVRFSEERAIWRDSHALFAGALEGSETTIPPASIVQFAGLKSPKYRSLVSFDRAYDLSMFGMASDQARILLVRAESFAIHGEAFADPASRERVRSALDIVETTRLALRSAGWSLCAGVARSKDAIGPLFESMEIERRFWSQAGAVVRRVLGRLGVDESVDHEVPIQIRTIALSELRRATSGLGSDANALKAGAIAESNLRRGLREIGKETGDGTASAH